MGRLYFLLVVLTLVRALHNYAKTSRVFRAVDQTPDSAESSARKRTFGEISIDVDSPVCSGQYASPARGRLQRCCHFLIDEPHKVSCLPSLVVMGTQKSGTTVLHGYLLLHPNILHARKKELHVFDMSKGPDAMARKFAELLPIINKQKTSDAITLDSSPSYIADTSVCQRLNQFLSPDATFVVLVREPVARAWSDVQMKRRRIASQAEFLEQVLPNNAEVFRGCLEKRTLAQFKACLPPHVSSHGRIPAFFSFISKQSLDQAHNFSKSCLGSKSSALSCLTGSYHEAILTERFPDILRVLKDEMTRLRYKIDTCYYSGLGSTGFNDDKQESDFSIVRFRELVKRCLPRNGVMSDISKNYLWRSLYHPQLQNCIAELGQQRILIQDHAELVNSPQLVVHRILRHAGLEALSNPLDTFHAREVFAAAYPDFESVSGWAKRSGEEDETIPDALRRELEEFFRPFNRRLFQLLGVKPFVGWTT